MAVCPHCHQHIGVERLGVRVTPLKARIIDMVKAAGDIGITTRELRDDLYRDQSQQRSTKTVGCHIHQLNEMLEHAGWVIAADGRGRCARLYLRRRRLGRKEAA